MQGSGIRTSGRFVLLSLRNADRDAPLSKLLVGEWFISKILHTFVFPGKLYINNITCIKPHVNEQIGDKTTINMGNFIDNLDYFNESEEGQKILAEQIRTRDLEELGD